jgi:hypothetical protein
MYLDYQHLVMAPTAAATAYMPTLTQSGARVALQAAEQHALDIGVPMYGHITYTIIELS